MSDTPGQTLMGETLVWDAHAGIFPSTDADLSGLVQWKAAGVDYVSINVGFDVMSMPDVICVIAAYRQQIEGLALDLVLVGSLAEVDAARAQGKLAVSFDIEGTNALNDDIRMVALYHQLGVRQMLLAYNLGNSSSGGCHDEDTGLTAFGRAVIAEMHRVGMTIDLSHMSKRSTLEAAAIATKAVVFTHSNPTAIHAHQRNIDDEQIRACAATGGVVGVNGMGIFMGDNDVSEALMADHVCHLADLIGPAHVAFGLDWKPASATAPDLGAILRARPDYWPPGNGYDTPGLKVFAPTQLPRLIDILAARGWSEAELRGFLGGNFRRVVEATWH